MCFSYCNSLARQCAQLCIETRMNLGHPLGTVSFDLNDHLVSGLGDTNLSKVSKYELDRILNYTDVVIIILYFPLETIFSTLIGDGSAPTICSGNWNRRNAT